MSKNLIEWLKVQLAAVPDVRSASTRPDNTVIFQPHRADVVIATWMGARLYIYILPKVPKLRDLRNTLRENSRSGIGSLFLLNIETLPADGKTIKLNDWQDALSSLHHLYIYAYKRKDNDFSLTQVHFNPLNRNDEYRVWYFDEFKIENVSVRKHNISYGLRGEWYIGDIASPAYKRRINDERANQRFHYRTKYTQDIPNNGSKNGYQQRKDDLAPFYQLLEVDANADEDEIKRAFRRKALQFHPDVSALPRDIANQRFIELNEAYDQIKSYHGWA